MGPKPSPRHRLVRVDRDGNHELENCRWAAPDAMIKRTRDFVVLIDSVVNEHAEKIATLQNIAMAAAVETVWEALESGLLQFASSDEHLWIESCGSDLAERREAVKQTRAMLRCRRALTPPPAPE
jgi:hypothetical protein